MEEIKSKMQLKKELFDKIDFKQTEYKSRLTKESFVESLFSDKRGGKYCDPDKFFYGKFSIVDFYNNLVANKKTILEFCIKNPNISYNMLYWFVRKGELSVADLKDAAKGQPIKIPKLIKEILHEPENAYKIFLYHASSELIYDFINEDKKWDVIEWLIQNMPEKVEGLIRNNSSNNIYKTKEFYERYLGRDDLPEKVQLILDKYENIAEGQRKRIETRRNKKMSFYDENGNLIKLFGFTDGMEISSESDYYLIAGYFLNSEMSVLSFCKEFKINSISGFREMCDKMSLISPEFAEAYKERCVQKSQELKAITIREISDLLEGRTSMGDIINKESAHRSFYTMLQIGKNANKGKEFVHFLRSVIYYYYERLNSYSDESTDEKDLLKMLNPKEVAFLMDVQTVDMSIRGNQLNLGGRLSFEMKSYEKYLGNSALYKLKNKKDGVVGKLDRYSTKANKQAYLDNETVIILSDGTNVKIDAKLFEEAEIYAKSHNLCRSVSVMIRIMRALVEGKIQNSVEDIERQNHIDERIELNKSGKFTMSDYLSGSIQYGE